MLKIDIKRINEKDEGSMKCAIQCAGTAPDIIAETAEVVKKIKESLAESSKEAEIAFIFAISAAIMDDNG